MIMATYKKIQHTCKYIAMEPKVFCLKDVIGDGNCFFHALVPSLSMNVDCDAELHRLLVNYIETSLPIPDKKILEIYKANAGDDNFTSWLQNLKQPGSWAGTCAATFLSIYFKINICKITNARTFLDGGYTEQS